MDLMGAVRRLYNVASDAPGLRGPIAAIRNHPRVRAFARRNVHVLLQRGGTWANVDGALRLLAEDARCRIVFGPWPGDTASELLYWAPFVRWTQTHFELDPERLVAISRGGVAHWYEGACATYVEAGQRVDLPDAAFFPAEAVLALVDEYRGGAAAPRPLMKRALHRHLPAPQDPVADGLPPRYVAAAVESSPAFPETEANRAAAADLVRRLERSLPVVSVEEVCRGLPAERRRRAQHAVIAGASGLVTAWPGPAVVGVLAGVPVLALRSADGIVIEPDVDLALRVATELSESLTLLRVGDLNRLFTEAETAEARGTVTSIPWRAGS
jgi:hypothetical protein